MNPLARPPSRYLVRRRPATRLALTALAFAAMLGGVGPAWSAPAGVSAARTIYPERPLNQFPDYVGRNCAAWARLRWPSKAGDYRLHGISGRVRSGGRYQNRPNDPTVLPRGKYHEYDVADADYSLARRGRLRLVRNDTQRTVYYTDDHYDNFTPIRGGC